MLAPSEFHQLLDAAPDAMVVLDHAGRVTALNREAERFFGWSEQELLGEPMSRFIPARFQRLLGSVLETDAGTAPNSAKGVTVSCFARRRDGSEFPVEIGRHPLGLSSDAPSLLTLRDLTQWRRTQEPRSRHNEQAEATLEAIGDAVITTDASGRINYLNPVAERLTGWTAEEAMGQTLDAVLPLISEATRQPVANTASRCLEVGRAVDLEEGVLLLRRDGTEVPIGDSAAPVRNRVGGTIGTVLVIRNESEKRRVGNRLTFEATHDALTGLHNRREFDRRLARIVSDLDGTPSEQVLLCLDLDRFKLINDTCGHDAGDDLLRSLGPLLSRHLRKRDTLARIGGDEFGVLLENCPLVEAERIAENLRAELEQFRFEWEGRSFSVGASIGLIPVTSAGGGVAGVLRAADAACYAAKEAGGNRVHIERLGPDSSWMPHALARRVTRLARAVDESHFQLYAQPIIALQPQHPAQPRFEVLLRLPDGQGGMQDAADFLPHAARYNLMPAIDRWVIRETIAVLGQWHREHPGSALPVCSINLSASALAEASLLPFLEQQLAKYGLPSKTLCFEIGETAAFANLARTTRFVSGLRTAGCEVALEDCGSGLASFTYLKTLSLNFIKIGGAFVHGVVDDPVFGCIVGALNQVGHGMGISTIAKQVGSQRVLNRLRALGVDYAQGRALTPPAPLTDASGRVMLRALQRSA